MLPKDREEIIQKLQEEFPIVDLIKFNEFDISEKLQNNAYLYWRYKDLYHQEKSILDNLLEVKERLIGKVYDYYRFESEKSLDKKEIITYYVPRDKRIIKINDLIAHQQVRVDYFEIAAEALNKQGWSMKNYLDCQKIL
jgi:hypothetical protein